MKTGIFLLIFVSIVYSQLPGPQLVPSYVNDYKFVNGMRLVRTSTGENVVPTQQDGRAPIVVQPMFAGSMIRWSFLDQVAIADRNQTSGNGLFNTVGWGLNVERVSLYGNSNSTPIWEFPTDPNTFMNTVVISENSDYIASGSYHHIYVFSRSSSTPVFDYNLEVQLPDTGTAGAVDINSNGGFIVASASRNDSSWIMGFQRTSTTPVWRYRVGQTNAGGAAIQGIRMSGNDSLVIVNTYLGVYVFRTYTGQLIYTGTVNPTNNNGTQSPQGISGNGNIIATINYIGFVRVLQWNGSTYNLLWQHQEPPGTYYNWMTTVDISYDGNMVACGTLNFITSSSYDGKIKFFRTATGSTPVWTYTGAGDEITCVSFSKNGNILAASSWGDLANSTYDLMVFKISTGNNAPIYQLNTPGSFFWCSASNDGSTVITSGKKVHARAFGNGGEVYDVFIDTNDAPLGIPGANNDPVSYSLSQNYPNPFNPSTRIRFTLPAKSSVKLSIYNSLGEVVSTLLDNELKRGSYEVQWNAEGYASGIYFYKLEAEGYRKTMKMILLK